MPKALVLGNGNILVGLDNRAQVRDVYFPFVGSENHMGGALTHRLGVWTGGAFRWFDDPSWDITVDCAGDTFASRIAATNNDLGVAVRFEDVVYNEKNIFVRKVVVKNLRDVTRTVKLFFGHQFEISESFRGDTAYFDPRYTVVVHYKGRRNFLINVRVGERGFDDYAIGHFEFQGKEGTFRDAEDGVLSKNPVEHGQVDSVIGCSLELGAKEESVVYYWMTVSKFMREAYALNDYVVEKGPAHLLKTTQDFWHAWVNRQDFSFYGLDQKTITLFKKSLFFIRAHANANGSIIASSDSDMLHYGRDTYAYMWPRDGALSALALDKSGDFEVAKRFFEFCNDTITDEGYFMHKYRPDGSLGSSWHPWIRDGKPELPIQEDETALVVWALWKHYELSRDLEFVESVYNSLIKRAADFMVHYTYGGTGLPYPSYDLWEEKYGVHTFTCGTVYGALMAAAQFAQLLGKKEEADVYRSTAGRMKEGVLSYLWDDEEKMFYKSVTIGEEKVHYDKTLDASSIYGVYTFGLLGPHDKRVKDAIQTVEKRLCCSTDVGGVPRYEGDRYYEVMAGKGNPWFVTTLWLAQYYIKAATSEKDMAKVKQWLTWTVKHALLSGVLSEQINPQTGEQLSAAPLTWSHSEFVITVIQHLEKLEELGICKACYPLNDR